jgi:uncharacterized protein YjgD (DUF1641 family)
MSNSTTKSTTTKSTTKNAPASETERLVGVISDALTDSMIERASVTLGNVLEVADHISEPDTLAAIHCVLDEITTLHRTGGLTTLFELIHYFNAMRNATTDSIVERGAVFIEHMINNLATEEIASLASSATEAMQEAAKETAETRHSGGVFSTLGMLSKPETQASLHFLLTFATKLQAKS